MCSQIILDYSFTSTLYTITSFFHRFNPKKFFIQSLILASFYVNNPKQSGGNP